MLKQQKRKERQNKKKRKGKEIKGKERKSVVLIMEMPPVEFVQHTEENLQESITSFQQSQSC